MTGHGFEDMADDLGAVYGPQGTPPKVGPSIASMMRAGAASTPMTRAQWQVTRDALAESLSRYEQMSPSCKSCLYLDTNGWCAKWEAKPPAEYQATGCDAWEHDGVPF